MIIYNATVNTFLRDCGLIAPFQNKRIKDESAKRGYPLNNTREALAWTSSLPENSRPLVRRKRGPKGPIPQNVRGKPAFL